VKNETNKQINNQERRRRRKKIKGAMGKKRKEKEGNKFVVVYLIWNMLHAGHKDQHAARR
jgi:hypothetical protein